MKFFRVILTRNGHDTYDNVFVKSTSFSAAAEWLETAKVSFRLIEDVTALYKGLPLTPTPLTVIQWLGQQPDVSVKALLAIGSENIKK